jgi:hypothetical protein
MNLALGFLKQGETVARQRQQRRPLHLRKDLADLLPRGAVNPRVGDGRFPALQVLVLFGQA